MHKLREYSDAFEYEDGILYSKISRGNVKVGDRVGSTRPDGYRRVMFKRKLFYEHRLIWEMFNGPIPEGYEIDHINRNRSDNRIENLRLVTRQGNSWNTEAKGFFYRKNRGKYRSEIVVSGKCIYIGSYETEQEAHEAYLQAKEVLHKLKEA